MLHCYTLMLYCYIIIYPSILVRYDDLYDKKNYDHNIPRLVDFIFDFLEESSKIFQILLITFKFYLKFPLIRAKISLYLSSKFPNYFLERSFIPWKNFLRFFQIFYNTSSQFNKFLLEVSLNLFYNFKIFLVNLHKFSWRLPQSLSDFFTLFSKFTISDVKSPRNPLFF